MSDVKSDTIVPIAIYCYVLGGYFLFLAVTVLFGHREGLTNTPLGFWLILAGFIIFACWAVVIGKGLLDLSQWSWKALFFSLVICVSSIGPFYITMMAIFYINTKHRVFYYNSIHAHLVGWLCFTGFFLSEIVVLYYLCKEEVIASFGNLDELIKPS